MANWFVGIPVASGPWFSRLVSDAPEGVRVFHADDLHITVAFLGHVGEERARAAWAFAERSGSPAIAARLGGLRAFGNPRRPSALGVVLEQGNDEVARLIAELRAPMIAAAGARPDDRPPHPHFTVARPARAASPAARRRAVAWAAGQAPIHEMVSLDRLALYTWSEDRGARQFRVVAERRLEPCAPPS